MTVMAGGPHTRRWRVTWPAVSHSLLVVMAAAQEPPASAGVPPAAVPAKDELSLAPAKVDVKSVARDEGRRMTKPIPSGSNGRRGTGRPSWPGAVGHLQAADNAALLGLAREHKTVVRMEHGIGEFVVQGTPLARGPLIARHRESGCGHPRVVRIRPAGEMPLHRSM
jgi:hypothetical protein